MPATSLNPAVEIKPRFFPRGYWWVVAVVVAIFALFDGLYVLRQRRNSTNLDLSTLQRYLTSYIAKDHIQLRGLVSEDAERSHQLLGRGPNGAFHDDLECDLKRAYVLDTTYLGEERFHARRTIDVRLYSVVLEFVGKDKRSRLARCRIAFDRGLSPTIHSIETELLVGSERMAYQSSRHTAER